jgi:hypothetical protein
MSKPYYERPLKPQPADLPRQGILGDEASDLAHASPGDDPTVPGTPRRGEAHLNPPPQGNGKAAQSNEARNQQATSGKSRAESGTP